MILLGDHVSNTVQMWPPPLRPPLKLSYKHQYSVLESIFCSVLFSSSRTCWI